MQAPIFGLPPNTRRKPLGDKGFVVIREILQRAGHCTSGFVRRSVRVLVRVLVNGASIVVRQKFFQRERIKFGAFGPEHDQHHDAQFIDARRALR